MSDHQSNQQSKILGAELKTIRESMSLTIQWLADVARVSIRTAQYWESGQSPVPDDVAVAMIAVESEFKQKVDNLVEFWERNGLIVTLMRYRTDADLWESCEGWKPFPATFHAQILLEAKKRLLSDVSPFSLGGQYGGSVSGRMVRIVWFDKEKFQEFLNRSGLIDNPESRHMFAGTLNEDT